MLSAQQQAQEVHAAASALGAQPLPPAPALVEGSHRLRTAFLAAVFRARRGLAPDAESLAELRDGVLSVSKASLQISAPARYTHSPNGLLSFLQHKPKIVKQCADYPASLWRVMADGILHCSH